MFWFGSPRSYPVIKSFDATWSARSGLVCTARWLFGSVQIQKTPHLRGFLLIVAAGIECAGTRKISCPHCLLAQRYHVDGFAAQMTLHRKLYVTVGLRKQRMVPTTSDICSRMELGTPLAHDNVSSNHVLAAKFLHAESFRLRIATVAGTAACFLMCHAFST